MTRQPSQLLDALDGSLQPPQGDPLVIWPHQCGPRIVTEALFGSRRFVVEVDAGAPQPVVGNRQQDRTHPQCERRVALTAAAQGVLEERDSAV